MTADWPYSILLTSPGLLDNIAIMFGFRWKKPHLGLELTAAEIRVAVLSGKGNSLSLLDARTAALPAGIVNESFSALNIIDVERYAEAVKDVLGSSPQFTAATAAISLPDAAFRVQALEFDDLPKGAADQERLIRWRFEKTAAFDLADTELRYQVMERRDQRVLLMCCIGKRGVIGQYEEMLRTLGLEPWHIGPSSLHTLNLYAPALARRSDGFALACVTKSSLATIMVERGTPRFYRFKEVRSGGADEVQGRLARELHDSLHFYMHQDRLQESLISRLFLSGDQVLCGSLAAALHETPELAVELVTPGMAIDLNGAARRAPALPENMDAALGAGGML